MGYWHREWFNATKGSAFICPVGSRSFSVHIVSVLSGSGLTAWRQPEVNFDIRIPAA